MWVFLLGFIADNDTKDGSLSRLLAIVFAVVAIIVALKCPPTAASAAIVSAFVSGGAVSLLTRNQGHAPFSQ